MYLDSEAIERDRREMMRTCSARANFPSPSALEETRPKRFGRPTSYENVDVTDGTQRQPSDP
jgi:hypothetical protein